MGDLKSIMLTFGSPSFKSQIINNQTFTKETNGQNLNKPINNKN